MNRRNQWIFICLLSAFFLGVYGYFYIFPLKNSLPTKSPLSHGWVFQITHDASSDTPLISPALLREYILHYFQKIDTNFTWMNEQASTFSTHPKNSNLYALEQHLLAHPLIAKASVFYNLNHQLCVDVVPRSALVQVFPAIGTPYFVDAQGFAFTLPSPLGMHVQLARGDFPSIETLQQHTPASIAQLLTLANWIENPVYTQKNNIPNHFWRKQIDHIYYDKEGFFLQTKVGIHTIVLGDTLNTDKIAQRMQKLYRLYTKGLEKMEWQNYHTLDLRFEHQVVASAKNGVKK